MLPSTTLDGEKSVARCGEKPSLVNVYSLRTGTSPFFMGKSPFFMGKSHLFMGKSPFLMGKSPFLMGKSPFLMGKSQFFASHHAMKMGKSTISTGPCSIAM